MFKHRARSVGLPPIRLHDLRHTWATLALQAGVPVKIVSEILGHASVTITYDTYSHVSPAMQADATTRVSALVFGSQGD
jgi:integrase